MTTKSSRPASISGLANGHSGCGPRSCPAPSQRWRKRLKTLALHRVTLAEGAVLETGCVYIVPAP